MRASLLIIVLTWTATALGEAPDEVFEAGIRAMERQDWVAAELLFRQALETEPTPRLRLNLAEVLFERDRLTEARAEAESVAQGDDLLLGDAARMLVERIDGAFARLRLRAAGLPTDQAEFHVDGFMVAAADPIRLSPGEHHIVLLAEGRPVAEETVTLARGEEREVVLTFETSEPDLSPEATAEAGLEEAPQLLGGPRARQRRRRRIAIGVVAAIAVVAIAIGVGFAVGGNGDPEGPVEPIVFELR